MNSNPTRVAALALGLILTATACGADGETSGSVSTAAPETTLPETTLPETTLPETTLPETTLADSTLAETTLAETGRTLDCAAVPTGQTDFVLDAGGGEHAVRVYVPTTYDGTSELPVVLNFHGFGSTGEQQAAFTGYEGLAEEEGFIVVHPTAVPGTNDEQGRNSWEVADIDDPGKDDLAFVDELLDLLIGDYCADDNRVYATGMSGGGIFASRLVCDMSDRIAAAVSVAALVYSDTCDPQRAVPFMAIHGTEDPTVPFDGDLAGTRFEAESFAEVLFEGNPIPDQFNQFAVVAGCDLDGERTQQSNDIFVTTYSNCDDGVPMVFYEVVGGGHAWPSSPLTAAGSPFAERLAEIQGYSTFEIDGTVDGWTFMSQHTLEG